MKYLVDEILGRGYSTGYLVVVLYLVHNWAALAVFEFTKLS